MPSFRDHAARSYVRRYEGYSYDFEKNGEARFQPFDYKLNDFTSGPNDAAVLKSETAMIDAVKVG